VPESDPLGRPILPLGYKSHGRPLLSTQQFQRFLASPSARSITLSSRTLSASSDRAGRAPLTDVNTHISPKSVYMVLVVLLFVVMN
jgi:hypothetical protein